SKRERLKEFYLSIKDCKKCDLSKTRTNFVFGSGNAEVKVILVGEAPGKNEDLQGKPFVGQAGILLDELLASVKLTRNDVFIANVLKCRPPLNRDPSIIEINTCKPYLFRQIEVIDPAVICTMGRYSTQLILDTQAGISSLRGNIYKKSGRIILPINHPAAALYTRSRMQFLKEDFIKLKKILDCIENKADLSQFNIIAGLNGNDIENPSRDVSGKYKGAKVEKDEKKDVQARQLGLF
ncbi:MAG: uracil-DNA glycosylase, partial [Actinobacteria bacterium]|nr:uracil-DNA glycosylase [Actinomycetota bacterium]